MREEEPPESAIWLHGSRGFGITYLPRPKNLYAKFLLGKTILASILVDELKSLGTQGKKGHIIPQSTKTYYFYCQVDDSEQRTYLDILKGILQQMVHGDDYILPFCDEKISHEGIENLANAEMAQTLVEAFIEYNPRQYIIIDGLDECDPVEIRRTADFFMKQVSRCDNNIKQGQLRVLFISQPMPDLYQHMPEDDASIPLKATDNADDIRAYVKARILQFSELGDSRGGFNLSEVDKAQIENIICQQSAGNVSPQLSKFAYLNSYLAARNVPLCPSCH